MHDAPARIGVDDPRRGDVRALLERHLAFARATSPREDAHALDADALVDPAITLFSLRTGEGALLGIAALRELGDGAGEIKSMHTVQEARGRGVARALVEHVIAVARERGLRTLLLETGTQDAFEPARRLYAAVGFEPCEPFAGYRASANTAYFRKPLQPGRLG